MNDLKDAIEKGTRAWADVPNATEWAEELRGNVNEWVGLTDEELFGLTDEMYNFARHIEAKLKERNT